MLRIIFSRLWFVCCFINILATIEVDIDSGVYQPIDYSVTNFYQEGSDYDTIALADSIRGVVLQDLSSSGLFKINSFLPYGYDELGGNKSQLQNMRANNIKLYVSVKVLSVNNVQTCQIKILYDEGDQSKVQESSISLQGRDFRLVGHLIANLIYKTAWNINGDFDSEIICVQKFGEGANMKSKLLLMDRDGYNVQIIDQASIILTPSVSKDGQYILYAKYVNDYPCLFLYDRRTQVKRQLTNQNKTCCSGVFLDDGSIIFGLSRSGSTSLFQIPNPKAEEIILKQLTNPKKRIDTNPCPTHSPDHIIFVSDRTMKIRPYVLNIKTGEIKALDIAQGSSFEPSCCINPFNEKVTQMCYSRVKKPYNYLSMVTFDANFNIIQERDLWQGARVQGPSWSVNGTSIFFICSGMKCMNIFTGKVFDVKPKIEDYGIYESPVVSKRFYRKYQTGLVL